MIRKILSTLLLVLYTTSFVSFPVHAGTDGKKQVTIIMANHLSLENLQRMEGMTFGGWISKGVKGALNLRTAGVSDAVNNAITLGSGTRSLGPKQSMEAYNGDESVDGIPASDLYHQYTGLKGKEDGIFVPAYRLIRESNDVETYSAIPGLLGQSLKDHGLSAAVIGNSDLGKQKARFSPLLAMDRNGWVDKGDVSSRTNRIAPDRLYGSATDYNYLLKKYKEWRSKGTALMVLELGDLYRLYSMKSAMEERHFRHMENVVLNEMNDFMNQLIENQNENELVLFLSPMVNPEAEKEDSLMAPYVQLNPNLPSGILFTPTTRQSGILSNMDIAPTVLQWLEVLVPKGMTGQNVTVIQGAQSFWGDWEKIRHIYSTRSEVLYLYVTFQIMVLIMAAALWYYAQPENRLYQAANSFIRFLLLIMTFSPFLFLVLPLFPIIRDVKLTVLFLVVMGTALSSAVIRLPFPWMFFIISILNWVPILVDGILGQSMLMKRSYLGYDPVIGARFYGIGNEYMGVVIGSSILSLVMLLELTKRRLALIKGMTMGLFGLYLLFFSLPGWGTNAGGAITAVAAYSISFVRLFDIQLNRRFLFWGILSVFISVFALFFLNIAGDQHAQSHIGRAIEKLLDGDVKGISQIVERKLQMNKKLIGVSSWSKVFITSILVLGLLCYRPAGAIRQISERYPYAVRGFFGIVVGAFTALLFNDSGVVAAATTIVYMVIPLLFLGLREKMRPSQTR